MDTLQITDIAKRFKSKIAVDKISFNINQGEIVSLLGPNGAGKTTCFYMVVGLVEPDSGSILLNDKDISNIAIHERSRLGISYLPQEASIFRKLSVSDNILAILQLRKDLDKYQKAKKLQSLMEEFSIGHLHSQKGMSLSGGERRRVEIARALALEPKFILLDEPFAGIDPLSIIDIKSIIKSLAKRNIGVLITDHNVRETLDICDRAYIINAGQVLSEGNTETILQDKKAKQFYLGDEFSL